MPRYFFDLDLNGQMQRDTSGRDLEDRDAARKRADDVVRGIAGIWDTAKNLECACKVRDEQGRHIYRQSLAIQAATPDLLQAAEEGKARRAAARAARLAAQELKARGTEARPPLATPPAAPGGRGPRRSRSRDG
jgi:hypothetical protein